MCCLIHYFFGLILGVIPNFSPDVVHKSLKFSESVMQKDFESVPGNANGFFTFELILVLLLMEKS